MVYLSFIGILITIILFMVTCFKGIPVTVSSVILILVIWLFSAGCEDWQGFDNMISSFGIGAGNILSKYLLLFMVSAMYGSIINSTGIASALGRGYESLVMRAPQKIRKFLAAALVPVLNALFIYAGISVYVVVFAVVAVARDLFKRMDIPWYMYSLSTIGSASFAAISLPGSPSIVNLAPIPYTGTGTAPAPLFSAIITIICICFGVLYMLYVLKRAERKGEGFLPSGAEIDKMVFAADSQDAPVKLRFALPLVILPVILMNFFKLSVVLALIVSNIALLCAYHKRLPKGKMKSTIISGLEAGMRPALTLGLMSGFAAVLTSAPGFRPVMDLLYSLPLPGYLKIIVVLCVVSFLIGNYNAAVPACIEIVGQAALLGCGVSMDVMHRLITISSLFCISPHNSGLCNSISVAKLSHKDTYRHYFMIGPVLGFILLIVSIVLINFGIIA